MINYAILFIVTLYTILLFILYIYIKNEVKEKSEIYKMDIKKIINFIISKNKTNLKKKINSITLTVYEYDNCKVYFNEYLIDKKYNILNEKKNKKYSPITHEYNRRENKFNLKQTNTFDFIINNNNYVINVINKKNKEILLTFNENEKIKKNKNGLLSF
ncbi:hypothetical protein LbFV_ORF28 [Leptopilina boulardi filamentous virus]|uniref:Uncharacterized protein n=1 Tax=Leptopilina boulardi filamentous virus TaxID=552509 RepID=A0A1S5YD69_9VIRU|nr:hypothetical protein LbFV_ORF28 [Leptopilina boulardi filamentous virus]AQQ79948.1 hypothetical protein LbFV_ORF28 [Leptopilina boulardi filamentous virus]